MKSNAYQRVNISLPRGTLRRIDRTAERGDRSRLIDQAVTFYLKEHARSRLRSLLKEGALARAERDRTLAADLFDLDDLWGKRER
jgi:CopG family transcriptional regulator/antitoxin EndoAI